ncbi:hypothetical protein BC835DRAFT_1413178 [Cytidiella melzeri]|nr:hypothetical protein BC835DRAFT_1413178 [Cytidiella melzeri]
MGLSGRKQKQRIPNDPRNLSWADDANKFGAAYMQKLGWSAGSGLGASGDGRTSHIKVNQKLDMLGIGAAHQKDPNGIAWKQNKDFENLLRRLNAGSDAAGEEAEVPKIDGFAKATEGQKDNSLAAEVQETKEAKKKRKRDKEEGNAEVRKKLRKSKDGDGKEDRKKRKDKVKPRQDEVNELSEQPPEGSTTSLASPEPSQPVLAAARPLRVHRARFLASKRLASHSSTAIDEILGISRSATTTPYPSGSMLSTPLDTPSSTTPAQEGDSLTLEKLTTSSKTVMDYFKEKLLAKSSGTSTPTASTLTSMPRDVEESDQPRGGLGIGFGRTSLGAGRSSSLGGGIGSSKLRSEVSFTDNAKAADREGSVGLGVFSRMSAMFASATSQHGVSVEETIAYENEERVDGKQGGGGKEKKKKSKKGKERCNEVDDAEAVEKAHSKCKRRKDRSGEPPTDATNGEKTREDSAPNDAEAATLKDLAEVTPGEEKLHKRKEKKLKRKAEKEGDPEAVLAEESQLKKKKSRTDKSSKVKEHDED